MSRALRRFAWGVLFWNLAVVVWGAYVRASGSGAGCGSHWPTCNGDVVPRTGAVATLIEFSHRATSGLALIAVVVLVVWTFVRQPAGAPARKTAALSLLFMLLEAAIGAGLVLFEWVAGNKSLARGFVMGAHLVNTFLLLGALALTAWHLSGGPRVRLLGGRRGRLFALAILAVFVTGASGGIAALGDTLYPARSLAEGLAQDASATAHVFLRLRVLHPIFAVVTAGLLLSVAGGVAADAGRRGTRVIAVALGAAVLLQVALGVADIFLLAPVPLQLAHLLVADTVWILFILTAAESQR